MGTLSEREREEVERANAGEATPVLFVHGLFMLASCWDRWRALFDASGYATLAPGYPDEPETIEQARAQPERFARKGVRAIAEHMADVVRALERKPAIVGHSLGGLIAQQLAGMAVSRATVAINPAPFRGVLPLPRSALKSAFPILRSPKNYDRAVSFTYEQFRFAFANALDETEGRAIYETFMVPASGATVFQVATANLDPWTQAKVETTTARRGPLLFLSAESDNFLPQALALAAYRRQKRNPSVTAFQAIPGRGHSLTIDGGWRAVADAALDFLERHAGEGAG